MTHTTSSPALGARRIATVLVAGLALALTACERESPSSQAITQASISLQGLAPGGISPPAPDYRKTEYSKVIADLQKVGSSSSKSEAAAASLLTAQAQIGLADLPAADAAALERDTLNQITGVRAILSQWYSYNALADAAASYNPAKELEDIAAQIKDRTDKRVAAQNHKTQVDAQVAQLQSQAKAKGDASKAKQQEAGALRAKVTNQTAVQGEQTLKQAYTLSRESDALEVEASHLDAEAAKIAPESAAIQLEIDRLSNQKDLLDKARADVQRRDQVAKANADEAHKQAADAAKNLSTALAELDKLRSGDLAAKTAEAVKGYESAAASAQKASSESKASAQLTIGAAQQALGDVHWTEAHGLDAYATLLETLAGAKPALPESASYKNKAAEVRTAHKAALDAATAAYKAADTAYRANGTAAGQERLDRLNDLLAKAVKITSGGAEDIRIAPAGGEAAPATPAPEAGGSAAIDPNSPQATIQALLDLTKSGSFDKLPDLFYSSSDQEKQTLAAIMGIAPKFKHLNDAMKAKFGKGLEELAGGAGGMPGVSGDLDFEKLKNINASDFQVSVSGDTAQATPPGGGKALKLVKKDNKWLVENPFGGSGPEAQQIAMALPMLPAIGTAADELAGEVEAGKYADPQSALAAFQQKMMKAAMPGGR